MDREKFQQKVLRQAKQKKSKSAEFLMAPLHVDKRRFCADRLRRPLGESGYTEARDESSEKVPSGPAEPRGSSESLDCRKEDSDPTSASREAFERYTQEGVIWLGNSPLKQDLKFEGEELSQHIPMSCLGTDKTFGKSVSSGSPRRSLLEDLHVCKEDSRAKPGTVTEGAPGPRQKALQVEMECVRGLKNKTPPGSYLLSVSLLRQLGGCAVQRWQPDHLKTRTHPVRHDGNFYDVGLYFHEHLYVVPPPTKDVKPGMAFLFELVLLRGKDAVLDRVVGWSAFPLCDNNLDVVEGKFKCPLLRGHYDQRLDTFRKIEDLICLDLDHWLCNLYFQVTKVPPCLDDHRAHAVHTQRPIGFPVCLMAETEKAESGMENTAGLSGEGDERNLCALVGGEVKSSLPSPHGSIFNKTGPCPVDCDLDVLEEDQELHHQGERWIDHPVKDIPVARRTGVMKGYTQDVSYLEKLQKHRISVCCPPVAGWPGPGEFFRHLRLAQVSLSSELQLAQWRSQGFWYVILLLASVGVLRLHLHYLGQWLYLQATSAPVTEFRFSALTVELCYPASALHIREELLVVVAGPLLLNAAMIPLVLIRWGCRLLCASCPDVLSKLIVTMGLWTVLDPLAVFAVDAVLGRLTPTGEMPTADVAKLYWAFARTGQSGLVGAALTALIYALLFVISSSTLYLCGLRLHNDSWILDAFQRVHSEEAKFFMPYDLEISNQELSHIVKRSEQWRGINGERRKVAVYDYVWKSHGVTSGTPSGDLQHGNQVPESARGPGDVTSHVSIYTTHPSGFRELFRHFLRLPGGAIIEVFDVISGFQLLPGEVATAIQEHLSELDSTLRDTFQLPSKDRERIPSNEKELAAAMQSRVS